MSEHFEELSGKQFIQIAELLYKGGDALHCHVKAFKILARISRMRLLLLPAEFIERCLPFVRWVFADKKTCKQLLPSYKKYAGPISDFDNLKMKEFHFSEQYYREVTAPEGKESESLNKLVAVLYRPRKKKYDSKRDPDGDCRIDFNANEIAYHTKKVSRWPAAVKDAIFMWYDACRQELIANNELVFSAHEQGFESQFETGLYGMMRSLAGDKLGPLSQVEEMYVHTAMLELGLLKEEEKRIEAEIKNRNP